MSSSLPFCPHLLHYQLHQFPSLLLFGPLLSSTYLFFLSFYLSSTFLVFLDFLLTSHDLSLRFIFNWVPLSSNLCCSAEEIFVSFVKFFLLFTLVTLFEILSYFVLLPTFNPTTNPRQIDTFFNHSPSPLHVTTPTSTKNYYRNCPLLQSKFFANI